MLLNCNGVETREINQALRNNPKKFPPGYVIELNNNEKEELIKNFDRFKKLKHSTVAPHAFTEQGLYMLATILKGDLAISNINRLIQVLLYATSTTSFSQRSHIIQPTKLTLPPSEVESITQRSRIFHPAKSNPSPSEVVSVTSMKRMNLCNDVHDSICLLPKPNSLKDFFLQINATSATSHLNPLIINE